MYIAHLDLKIFLEVIDASKNCFNILVFDLDILKIKTDERNFLRFKDLQMKVSFDIKAFKSQFETFQGRECLIEESKS